MASYLLPSNDSRVLDLQNRSQTLVIVETLTYCTFIAMALTGNSLVLWIVYRNKSLRTIPNYFVISLAFTDIGMALFGTPWTIAVLATGKWPFDFTACQFQGFVVIWLAASSLQNLNIMAINRYFRIVKPHSYRRYFTAVKTRIFIVCAFFYAAVSTLPYVIGGNVFVFQPGKAFCYQVNSLEYTLPLMTIVIGIPTFIIVVCYAKVFFALRKHRASMMNPHSGTNKPRITVEDIRVTKTLFATVVGFLLCWMPVLVVEMVDLGIDDSLIPRQVGLMFTICGLASSVINPVIYGVMNKTFRREYNEVLRCLRKGHSNEVVAFGQSKENSRTENKSKSEKDVMN